METTRRGFLGRLVAAVGIVVGGTCLPEPRERRQFTTDTDHYPDQGWPRFTHDGELRFRDDEIVIMCEDSDITPGGSESRINLTRWPADEGSNFKVEEQR